MEVRTAIIFTPLKLCFCISLDGDIFKAIHRKNISKINPLCKSNNLAANYSAFTQIIFFLISGFYNSPASVKADSVVVPGGLVRHCV